MVQPAKTPAHAPAASALLDPQALSRLGRLDLVAKQVMDGFVQGMHKSPHVGFALDFAQHRQYVPGDDVKRIDWRVYAKADRYYIKQYEVTTNLRATIALDASASMRYQSKTDPMSKFRYGQFLAVCLAYLVLRQQDSAGLVTFDNKIRDYIPARSAPSHLMTIAQTLERIEPASESAIAPLLHDIAERIGHRGLVVIISDFFDNAQDLLEAFHHLHHKRHEVVLLQVMASDELTFPFRKFSEFENLEKPAHRQRLDPALMRARYLENLNAHIKIIRDEAGKLGFDHEILDTTQPFDTALTAVLARRMGSK